MNSSFKSLTFLFILAVAVILFLMIPLPLLSSQEGSFCRGLLFFLPLADPSLYIHQIFGETFTLYDPDRCKIIAVGIFLFATVIGTGRIALHTTYHIFRPERDDKDFICYEELFLSSVLGMAVVSAYLFWSGFIGWINRYTMVPLMLSALVEILRWTKSILRFLTWKRKETVRIPMLRFTGGGFLAGIFLLLAVLYLLAGTIPPFEYDMLEYHAQGAREIFETGRIAFSGHNVYLNMPLGTEMFYLAGLLMFPRFGASDVDALCLGVTAGKFFLAFVPLLTALGAALLTDRIVNPKCQKKLLAYVAVLAVIANPNVFQVSANGLNDVVLGLAVIAVIYTAFQALKRDVSFRRQVFLLFLSGFSAGFAAACKYTAIPFAVFPIAIVIFSFLLIRFRRNVLAAGSIWGLAVIISGGGWYLKNLLFTGNPFYPLAYSVFGDRTGIWNAVKNARWISAHSPHSCKISELSADIVRLFTDNFASILLPVFVIFIFLLLARIVSRREKRPITFLTLYLLFFFGFWWLSTHRLIRFLVPVLPVAAVTTAIFWFRCYTNAGTRSLRLGYEILWIAAGLYALLLNSLSAPGILTPIKSLVSDPERYGASVIVSGSDTPEENSDGVLLLIGEARAFAYRRTPVFYCTCWDNSYLAQILPNPDSDSHNWKWSDEEIHQIKENFRVKGIKSILVDQNEVRRFLSDGNYGMTDSHYAEPELFESLVRCGIIEPSPLTGDPPNIKYYRVTED